MKEHNGKTMATKDSYIAGQTIHNRVEYDQNGNKIITNQVIYEQKEFVEGYVDLKLPKRHKFTNGGFLTIFQKPLQAIVKDGKLSKSEMALLLWLLSTAGMDGSVDTNLKEIEEVLHLSKSMASRAVKGLVQRNIIIRRDGNRFDREPLSMELLLNNSYDQLNYGLAYNGKTALFKEKKRKHPAIELPCGDHRWVNTDTGEIIDDTNQQ